ncbi:MAG TPA: extracellular solute-binding protein [Trebonia sp.]|jgi:N,N'-diacetylchitobiose transport system substrate-binding protein|nr:extracellular solute-binding protein [Trebonia sp.]
MRHQITAAAAACAAAAIAITGCGSSSGGGNSGGGSASGTSSAVPSELTVWRMGSSVASEVKWMNGVEAQFHKDYPAYKNTRINVVWVPWTNATSDFNTALTSGKNAPDITEIGNTETPTEAELGGLANITSNVNSWTSKSDVVKGMLANDTSSGSVYAVPWFGGVRGVWYRKDQFQKAGITSTPTTWSQLTADAQKLQQKFSGTYGIDAPTNDTDSIVSFIWGAGGQVATDNGGKWTADLTSAASEAGIKYYMDLYTKDKLSPSKYIGQTELGNPGATSGGANEDFALGKLDLYVDGPWASAEFPANATDKSNWASFPIPSENGPNPAPAFAGGSDLAVWASSKYKTADWDLIQVMDSETNSTSFANLQGFFPPFTSKLTGGAYAGSQLMSGFAKAATVTQISPLNAKNWSIADETDEIIPSMMKSLMSGASFASTVAKANTQLTNVLNTGQES